MHRSIARPTPSWPGPGNKPADIVPPGITVFPLQAYPAEGRPTFVLEAARHNTAKGGLSSRITPCRKTTVPAVAMRILTLRSCLPPQTGSTASRALPLGKIPLCWHTLLTGRFSSAIQHTFT